MIHSLKRFTSLFCLSLVPSSLRAANKNPPKTPTFSVIIQGPISPISLRNVPTYLSQVDNVVISIWSDDPDQVLLPPTSWVISHENRVRFAVSDPPPVEHLPIELRSALLQTITTRAALKLVDTTFVIKTRSDEAFANLSPFKNRVVREGSIRRLVTTNVVLATEPFRHISDHCYAGSAHRLRLALDLMWGGLQPDSSTIDSFEGLGGGRHFAESLLYEAFVIAGGTSAALNEEASTPNRTWSSTRGSSVGSNHRSRNGTPSPNSAEVMAEHVEIVPVKSLAPYVITSSRLPAFTAEWGSCEPRDSLEGSQIRVRTDSSWCGENEGSCLNGGDDMWPFPAQPLSAKMDRDFWSEAAEMAMNKMGNQLLRSSYTDEDTSRFGHRLLVTYDSTEDWLGLDGGESGSFPLSKMSDAEAISRDFLQGSLVWWGYLCTNAPPRSVLELACSIPPEYPDIYFVTCSDMLTQNRSEVVLSQTTDGVD